MTPKTVSRRRLVAAVAGCAGLGLLGFAIAAIVDSNSTNAQLPDRLRVPLVSKDRDDESTPTQSPGTTAEATTTVTPVVTPGITPTAQTGDGTTPTATGGGITPTAGPGITPTPNDPGTTPTPLISN
jgi:hypothetical protein